jgi:hypothetical protein
MRVIDDDRGVGAERPGAGNAELVALRLERLRTSSPTVGSTDKSPGYIVCGKGDAGKLRVDRRGASIACWTFIPKSTTFTSV